MKKYRPIDEVLKVYDVPKKLWETESLMKEIPNFDKSITESKKIYEYKEYIILQVKPLLILMQISLCLTFVNL